MSNTRIINESDKHYVVRSLEVLEGIKGAGISSIRDTIQTLQNAQQSLAQETQDYWSAAADDSMVSPEEKKMLYKEWQHLLDEYASLIQAAVKAQVSENSGTLAAYKNAYTQLYDYIIQRLKLFDDMTRATQLPDRRAFIDLYTTYYAMRDALRDTISLTQLAEGNADVIPPDRVTGLTVYAEEHIITLSWNALGDGLRNTLKQYAVTVKKAGSTEYVTAGAVTGNRFTYVFNRQLDGYPEKDELAKWSFKVTAVNIFNKFGMAAEKTVNTDGYGTWIPKEPIIVKRESNRQITLYFSEPENVYGNFHYKIQIKKITDAQWYKPATSGDYLASEDAYKAGDGWETVSQLFSQTLPLEGQNAVEPLPVDTAYIYRVSAYNETGKEAVRQIEAIAHATGVRDIVAAAITTNKLAPGAVTADKIHAGTITGDKIAATNLAANGAVLGNISGNGIDGGANNFWKGLDTDDPEFRIGNNIAWEDDGESGEHWNDAVFVHYKAGNLFMKLYALIVTAIKSAVRGVFQITTKNAYTTLVTFNPEHTDFTDFNGKKTKAKSVQIHGNIELTSEIFNPAEIEVLLVNGMKLYVNGKELKVNNFTGAKKSNGDMTVSGDVTAAGIVTAKNVIIQSGKFETRSIKVLSDFSAKTGNITDTFSAGDTTLRSLVVTKNTVISGVLSANTLRIPAGRPATPTTGDIWLE